MVVIISYTFDIPDTVAGLTVLAAGKQQQQKQDRLSIKPK
jgi:hypothetical protein